MKRIYVHYTLWEDFINGMWRNETKEYEETHFEEIVNFTGNHNLYGEAMLNMVENWNNTCLHNLTDNNINKRAFVGHAACCFKFGWPEYLVRRAWNTLSKEQQINANAMADKAIEFFLKKIHTNAEN